MIILVTWIVITVLYYLQLYLHSYLYANTSKVIPFLAGITKDHILIKYHLHNQEDGESNRS